MSIASTIRRCRMARPLRRLFHRLIPGKPAVADGDRAQRRRWRQLHLLGQLVESHAAILLQRTKNAPINGIDIHIIMHSMNYAGILQIIHYP